MTKPRFFAKPAEFRAWLEKNHATAPELLVGFRKKGTGKPSITWSESVDQALCFGWIDGVRKRVDDECYTIRFTPRRPGSIWSAINIAKVEALRKDGLMRPAGLAAFEKLAEGRSRIYAYEQRYEAALTPQQSKTFESKAKAWTFFQAQPPSYRHTCIYWVTSAKKAETQAKRLEQLIAASVAGRRL